MKRSDKEKVLVVIFTPLFIVSPLLMDVVGLRWFIAIDCFVFLLLLLWYSYGPLDTAAHK
jgi:hypothetical protein